LKNLIYVYYFFRSALLRGPVNTVRLLGAELNHEKKFGIKTSAIKKSDSKEFFHYQGAGYLILLKVLPELFKETKHCDFVDIGCGKGRALFVAEYCGYNYLTGIELDADLIKEAEANVNLYCLKRKESGIHFICANALDYEYKNRPTLYFLFNPFSEEILERVVERILASTHSETWFVYMNPLYPLPFKKKKMEQVREFKTGFYTEALVFRTNAEKNTLH
jgi:SAM-dependent methyltransferase